MSFTTSAGPITSTGLAPPYVGLAPPPARRSLGTTRIGTSSGALSANVKRVNSYRLTHRARLLDLTIYLQPRSKPGSQSVMGIVYGTRRGKPGRLLARTQTLRFASTAHPGWYHLDLRRPLALHAGRYWLGLMSGARGGVIGYRYRSVPRSRDVNGNRFKRGPSKRFGHFSVDDRLMSLYASLG
jgi:hypothetical protein